MSKHLAYLSTKIFQVILYFFFQRNAFASDVIPSESYIDAILSSHMQNASSRDPMRLRASLKHVVHTLVKFSDDLIMFVEIRDVTSCYISVY